MQQNIYIARHGSRFDFVNPDWFNTAERPYDPPLSEVGFIQAQELGKRLKNEQIQHIFVSPFLRTVQTAHEVAKILELPLKLEAGLCEWLNPEWMSSTPERASFVELKANYPEIDENYQSCVVPQFPETEQEMMERTGKTARLLLEKYSQNILFVGHGASVLGTTWELVSGNPAINASFCCLVKVNREGENYELELNGDTSHLTDTEKTVRFN